MINIAILGGGVVGSGVFEVISKNSNSITKRAGKKICVKKVVDKVQFDPNIYGDALTMRVDDVFEDESIKIVVETIGGVGFAYESTKKALSLGKHVVTSNKELVATHGPELLQMASDNGVHYLFEASVGGGIPIIRPLNQCLAANELYEIEGILNGTTNYILTMMKKEGEDFSVALKEAQENGYAEADPTADIEGYDTCRKLAILSSISFGEFVDSSKIYTEGISKISVEDMNYAEEMDSVIKLIAIGKRQGERIFARVSPLLIKKSNPLANVDDVFNAIVVKGDAIGDAMFYGRGAGKLPTASAVVADIIDIVKNPEKCGRNIWEIPATDNIIPINECDTAMFIRVEGDNIVSLNGDDSSALKENKLDSLKAVVEKIFGDVEYISSPDPDRVNNEIAFVTKLINEKDMKAYIDQLKSSPYVKNVINAIRME